MSDISEHMIADDTAPKKAGFQALARKYRPQSFSEMVGQDVLVKTLSNALKQGRMHHAFMLTGVRGTGKTTTARIIARAVNCTGRDVAQHADPCETCDSCRAIMQESSMDVIEMDAASHTGVQDMRGIIESVKYRPVTSAYKIYIIDEVHMLSKSAFNALLKTLEEPPDYVKFIFATTELHKVPVTILSRCQHLELLRIESPVLVEYFDGIVKKENLTADKEALQMIVAAADGSVRDGQSLLDQAISLAGTANISAELVSSMLRLNEQQYIYQLLDDCFAARPLQALEKLQILHQKGGEAEMIARDLLNAVWFLTRLKIAPEMVHNLVLPEYVRDLAAQMAQQLSMANLTRIWQILQEDVGYLAGSPVKQQSLEMLLIKLCYAAELPAPAELIGALERQPVEYQAVDNTPAVETPPLEEKKKPLIDAAVGDAVINDAPVEIASDDTPTDAVPDIMPDVTPADDAATITPNMSSTDYADFASLVADITAKHEAQLAFTLSEQIICVQFAPPLMQLYRLEESKLGDEVRHALQKFLVQYAPAYNWQIQWAQDNPAGTLSLHQQKLHTIQQEKEYFTGSEFVKRALHLFPNAVIMDIKSS